MKEQCNCDIFVVKWQMGTLRGSKIFTRMADALGFIERNDLSFKDTEIWKRVYVSDGYGGDTTDVSDLDECEMFVFGYADEKPINECYA